MKNILKSAVERHQHNIARIKQREKSLRENIEYVLSEAKMPNAEIVLHVTGDSCGEIILVDTRINGKDANPLLGKTIALVDWKDGKGTLRIADDDTREVKEVYFNYEEFAIRLENVLLDRKDLLTLVGL